MPDPLAGLPATLPRIEVEADLVIGVRAPTGESTTARVSGSGRTIRVEAAHPTVLLAAVAPSDVGVLADLLAASDLRVEVSGPDGPVASVGAGVTDRVGRLVTGSSRVAPAPRAALRIAAGSRPVRLAGVAAGVLVLLGWLLARRRP